MSKIILPFSPEAQERYQLIELILTNGRHVLAVTAPFIEEETAKQVLVKKFLVHPPLEIPRDAKKMFQPLFQIFKNAEKAQGIGRG